ncbi:MAG TPA: ABC transporter ATP-binding protein [Candidatus Caldiarchaeum subterraneum]|uniref:Probable branched-chain amino acid transport ATP-binding protein LivG n=1 Tax=Caldiarchaeum subterraneum TaxID=311458 RepID=A0A833ECR1_CALS0|nr:ABC transporter ATP-binding protein [Candidatus Caldarchaeum subterraneum]
MRTPILKVGDVTKTFGGLVALDKVRLDIQERLITMLIGPNGSGKTTLINVVTGFYKPDNGRVFFRGIDITGKPPHEVYRLGLVRTFQIPLPFQRLTVLENLLAAYRGNPGESILKAPLKMAWREAEEEAVDKAFEIMEHLKLTHLWNSRAYALSGGQMKLLEIGRALMSGATMIMMDEPIAGINPALAHEIFEHMQNLRDKIGVTFLVIEHRLEIALKYTDYVYALANGKLVAEGRPEAVMADSRVIESYLGEAM